MSSRPLSAATISDIRDSRKTLAGSVSASTLQTLHPKQRALTSAGGPRRPPPSAFGSSLPSQAALSAPVPLPASLATLQHDVAALSSLRLTKSSAGPRQPSPAAAAGVIPQLLRPGTSAALLRASSSAPTLGGSPSRRRYAQPRPRFAAASPMLTVREREATRAERGNVHALPNITAAANFGFDVAGSCTFDLAAVFSAKPSRGIRRPITFTILDPAADEDDEPVAANRDLSRGKARNFTPDPTDPRPTLGDAVDERREERRQTEAQPRRLSAAGQRSSALTAAGGAETAAPVKVDRAAILRAMM